MTKAQIETLIADHGLTIDHVREGAGKFRDLCIGTGAAYATLQSLCKALLDGGLQVIKCAVTHVTNETHPQHGKPYLTIESVWWE